MLDPENEAPRPGSDPGQGAGRACESSSIHMAPETSAACNSATVAGDTAQADHPMVPPGCYDYFNPPPQPDPTSGAEPKTDSERFLRFKQVIDESIEIHEGSGAQRYLNRRGIIRWPDCIRCRPIAQRKHGTVVALATNDDGEVTATHSIHINADGTRADPGRFSDGVTKRTNGWLKGSVVRLPGDYTKPIVICEGVEDGLSIWQASGRTVWVALGVDHIGHAPVKKGTTVVVARDNDEPDSAAYKKLDTAVRRLQGRGVTVLIADPSPDHDFNDILVASGDAAVSQHIEAAELAPEPQVQASMRIDPADKRPRVLYGGDNDLNGSLDRLDAALVEAVAPIYRMEKRIVHAIRLRKKATEHGVTRQAGSLVLDGVNATRLYQYIVEHIRFTKMVSAGKLGMIEQPGSPPRSIASDYAARPERMNLRILRGVAEHPCLRADGTVVAVEGYDEASGMLLDFGGTEFPAIPEHPTKEQALAALELLKEPLRDFPFVPDEEGKEPSASRSVALSAILSPFVCRPMRIPCPLHAASAPERSTGKTLLLDTAARIVTGRTAPAMTWSDSDEENVKQFDGILLRGDPMVSIDNVDAPLGGRRLCSIITGEEVQVRILGSTGQHDVETDVVFSANGDNLVMEGDLTSRSILCRLDAGMEHPETRAIERDLTEWVPANRPALVAAALTVLRAYIAAGRPWDDKKHERTRFRGWDLTVRGALLWLGEPDPCANRDAIESVDPVRASLQAVVAGILATGKIEPRKAFAASLIATLGKQTDPESGGIGSMHPELAEALDAVCPHGINAKAVSTYLAAHKDRIVGGLRLEAFFDAHAVAQRFRLMPANAPTEAAAELDLRQ